MTDNIRAIDSLVNWDKNPRDITTDDLLRLKRQITRLGKYKPLLITNDGVVIGGNMRLKALKELGQTDVKVTVLDFIKTDEGYQVTIDGVREGNAVFSSVEAAMVEYALSDNDRAGFYLGDKLADLIGSVPDLELDTYRVDLGHLTSLDDLLANYATSETEDEVPDVDDVTIVSMPGEIYQLGRHRLMCGDATNLDQVKLLMNDQKADGDFYQFLYDAFVNMHSYSKSGASIYVCHADTEAVNFRESFEEAGFQLKQVIIWNKNVFVMGRQDYQWKHEPILYGWKEGESHQFYGGRDQTTVWDIERPSKSEEHPTMKPVALISKALLNNSKGEDIVMDLFGGSGSTLIACEETKRTCYTMELDPKYCDVIRKRYAEFIKQGDKWQEVTPAINIQQSQQEDATVSGQ